MFLSILNQREKEDFLNLLINVAKIDDDFSVNEKTQINAYVLEMGLEVKNQEEYSKSNKELISGFNVSSIEVKKAIFIEITALMLADGFHQNEEVLLEEIQNEFGLKEQFKEEVVNWYNEITPLYKKGFALAGLIGEKI